MLNSETESTGKLTIKSIRDFIIDNDLTEKDTIILNELNFDDLVLEHRETYQESMVVPFFLLSVLITTNPTNEISLDQIKIIKNDLQRLAG